MKIKIELEKIMDILIDLKKISSYPCVVLIEHILKKLDILIEETNNDNK